MQHGLRIVRLPLRPLLQPARTLLSIHDPAKQCGLKEVVDPPVIKTKLAELQQQQEETQDTAIAAVLETVKEQGPLIEQVADWLPQLAPETVWMPIVGAAVVCRSLHCLISKIRLSKHMEQSLPHTNWFNDRGFEFRFYKAKANIDKMREVRSAVELYKEEHGLKGSPKVISRRSLRAGALLAASNFTLLYGLSLYYKPLSGAPFLWVPDLILPDPLYILPAVNLALCFVLYRLNKDVYVRFGALPKGMSFLDTVKENPISGMVAGSVGTLIFGLIAWKTFGSISDHCMSHILLYWATSNATAICIMLALTKSEVVRRTIGLLPSREFHYLATRNALLPPQVNEERSRKVIKVLEATEKREREEEIAREEAAFN